MPATRERISTSLYELGDELQRLILEHVDEDTGELDTAFEAELVKAEGDWEAKCVQVALFAKGLICEGDATKAVAQVVLDRASQDRARAEVLYRQADRLMNYLDAQLQRQEVDEIKDPAVRIHYRRSSAIVIDEPSLVPPELMNEPALPQPSKTKIKAHLKLTRSDTLMTTDPQLGVHPVTIAHVDNRKILKLS